MTVRIRLKRQKRYSSFLKSGCSCGGFEAVLGKRTKKKSPANPLVYWTFWRRVRDSNPRSLSAYSISSAAPSTTRTTLRVLTLFYNFFSHFQPQLSLAFQKFSGSRGEKRREKRDYAKNMKSKKLVFMRVCGQKLSMNP